MKTLKNFPYHKVLVLGLAKSGRAAAKLLLQSGVKTRINDLQAKNDDEIVLEFKKLGAELIVGSHPVSVLEEIDLIVKNPGIPYEHPLVEEALSREIPIITEVELAIQVAEGSIIAITGSNGKTTTTTLVTKILNQGNKKTIMAGNIGTVASEVARTMGPGESMVLELSSFQLLGTPSLNPEIAVLLNIYEAHLDYHKNLHNYTEAKLNICKNQTPSRYLIYNADDPILEEKIKHKTQATLIPFSMKKTLQKGAWKDDSYIYFGQEKIIKIKEIRLVGDHNIENILATIAVAKLKGVDNASIRQVLTIFSGVEHRLEYVGEKHGRKFYNDSKATNMLATQRALNSFKEDSLILIAGGLDRGDDFSSMIPYFKKIKGIVTFGETAQKIQKVARKANVEFIERMDDLQAATKKAYELSSIGDIILLSPACASWDQFKTFEDRGHMFIETVHTLS